MIGTIANTATILAGSLVGSRLKSGLGEKYKEALMNGMGLAATLLGAALWEFGSPRFFLSLLPGAALTLLSLVLWRAWR